MSVSYVLIAEYFDLPYHSQQVFSHLNIQCSSMSWPTVCNQYFEGKK